MLLFGYLCLSASILLVAGTDPALVSPFAFALLTAVLLQVEHPAVLETHQNHPDRLGWALLCRHPVREVQIACLQVKGILVQYVPNICAEFCCLLAAGHVRMIVSPAHLLVFQSIFLVSFRAYTIHPLLYFRLVLAKFAIVCYRVSPYGKRAQSVTAIPQKKASYLLG